MGEENISRVKEKCQKTGGIIVFEDEAAFRQEPTLFRSWCRRGCRFYVPTYGQRNTQHVYGAVSTQDVRFSYRFIDTCNGSTHQGFLETLVRKYFPQKIFLVEDNARYIEHQKKRLQAGKPPWRPSKAPSGNSFS